MDLEEFRIWLAIHKEPVAILWGTRPAFFFNVRIIRPSCVLHRDRVEEQEAGCPIVQFQRERKSVKASPSTCALGTWADSTAGIPKAQSFSFSLRW